MSYYLKHPKHGNRHVETVAEADALVADGWVIWPRTKAQKEGKAPSPVVGYERPKLTLGKRK